MALLHYSEFSRCGFSHFLNNVYSWKVCFAKAVSRKLADASTLQGLQLFTQGSQKIDIVFTHESKYCTEQDEIGTTGRTIGLLFHA